MPDIFEELLERSYQLLKGFVEQKIYRGEGKMSKQINIFVEQLGYLQATPRDLIELHPAVLKQKNSQNFSKISKF